MNADVILNIPEYDGPGIYKFTGINNPWVYIGSSIHVRSRLKQHNYSIRRFFNSDKKPKCINAKMRCVLEPGFVFKAELLEKVDSSFSKNYLYIRERYYMNQYAKETRLNNTDAPSADIRRNIEGLLMLMREDEKKLKKLNTYKEEYRLKRSLGYEEYFRGYLIDLYKSYIPMERIGKLNRHERA